MIKKRFFFMLKGRPAICGLLPPHMGDQGGGGCIQWRSPIKAVVCKASYYRVIGGCLPPCSLPLSILDSPT